MVKMDTNIACANRNMKLTRKLNLMLICANVGHDDSVLGDREWWDACTNEALGDSDLWES